MFAVCALASAVALAQQTVYDNSATPLVDGLGKQLFHPQGTATEFGDEITLAPGDRFVSQIQFEYFGLAASGNFTLQFYDKPGGVPSAPGGLLFQSLPAPILADYHKVTVDLSATLVPVGDDLVWTVQFDSGNGGLLQYDNSSPGVIGSSFNDFWEKTAGGVWQLSQIKDGANTIPANFGAKVVAVQEPGTLATLLGGLAMLGVVVYRRRSA